jgi:PAS domain S-box-containing protein
MARKPKAVSRRESPAEALAGKPQLSKRATPATRRARLQHEVHLQQVELKMQNEELRRVQAALEASRDRYVELYDFAPAGYLTLSEHGVVQAANLTSAALLGMERKNVVGVPFAGLVAPEHADAWHLFLSRLRRQGGRHACGLHLRRADGSTLHAQLSCQREPSGDSMSSVRVVLVDLGERKPDASPAADEARFRALVEEAADAILLHDQEGRIREVNRKACQSLGYSREALLRMGIGDVEVDLDLATAQREWTRLEPGRSFTHLGRQRRKDGSIFPVEVHFTAIDLPGERLYMGLVRDVTSQRAADDAILASESRYRDLVDRAPEAMLVVRSHCVELVNRAATTLFGAGHAEQLLGRPIAELVRPEDRPAIRDRLEKLLAGGQLPPLRTRIVRLDGSTREVEVGGSSFPDADGIAVQVVLRGARREASA